MAYWGPALYEWGLGVENEECLNARENVDRKRFELDLDVWPVWTLMKPDEFRSGTVELFGSSKGVLDFVFQRENVHFIEKFWSYWKKWKKICIHNIMKGELNIRAIRMLHGDSLLLPGEPPGQRNK